MSLELVMIAPMLLFLFALVYAYGRVAQVHGLLQAGTRDAARTATDSRSYNDASRRANIVLKQDLAGAPKPCRDSAVATVDQHDFEPGGAVKTTATCTYSLSDVGLPGVTASLSPTAMFISILDPNRGLDLKNPVGP